MRRGYGVTASVENAPGHLFRSDEIVDVLAEEEQVLQKLNASLESHRPIKELPSYLRNARRGP